jgi:hypothetical protein
MAPDFLDCRVAVLLAMTNGRLAMTKMFMHKHARNLDAVYAIPTGNGGLNYAKV